MKQKKAKEEGEHEVNITVTITKASLTNPDLENKKSELPTVQNYFHCQYKLLPDDRDFVKTDVVTFGMAAKMYGENDSKVLRTWLDGNKTWVAWTNNRKVRVTQETLLKMFKHNFELKLWDTKEKVSAKARFDRPKAFRLPQTKAADEIDLDVVRELLMHEGKTNEHLGAGIISESSVPTTDNAINKKVSFTDMRSDQNLELKKSSSSHIGTTNSSLEVQVRLDENKQPELQNLMSLASSGPKPLAVDTEEAEEIPKISKTPERKLSTRDQKNKKNKLNKLANERDSNSALAVRRNAEAERIQQNGLASIKIPLSSLFTNSVSVSSKLERPTSSLEEVIVILTLDTPLLSDRQKQILNPMVLTVASATQMPNNFMSFAEMKTRCLPPYIKYKFHECPVHVSDKKEHGKTLKFNDRNVILLGVMNKEKLFEYFRGPTFKIEVHDRDPIPITDRKSSIFGSSPDDGAIWNVTHTGAQRGLSAQSEPRCTYGIAEFDLSELLSGERVVQMISQIRNFHKFATDSNHNLQLLARSNKDPGIPAGKYLEFGSDLKIKIELARSLIEPDIQLTVNESRLISPVTSTDSVVNQCPFNRMVYIFDYKNKKFLGEILSQVSAINARALDLSSYPQHVIDAALSTYKLTDQQKNDKVLDIITGCQIIDGNYHIFILEGIAKNGIKQIWDKLEHTEYNEDSFFRVLYNSGMTFTQRLYQALDVDLTRVRLHQPLATIIKQPLLYVRDMIPRLCFQAVTKLFQLCECTSLQSAIRNDILPTAEMIVSLGKEFGVPLTSSDLHDVDSSSIITNETSDESNVQNNDSPSKTVGRRRRELLDMKNEMYEKILEDRRRGDVAEKDHICANIKSLLTLSKSKQRPQKVTCDTIEVPHNYSIQTLNSTVMANEKLREVLKQEKDSRYTYCNEYNSATIVPVSVDKLAKEKEEMSTKQWKTKDGFVFPGFKSSTESNHHPKQLHPARVNELYIPWRENILHTNMVKSTVDRLLFKWQDRNIDFNTLARAEPFFGKPAPVTIHSAGDTLQNEQLLVKEKEERTWKEKLVVDDPQFKTHRCLIATELTSKGPNASNQQDKLTDILKDGAKKFSLAKPGMRHQHIPALSVLSYPSIDAYKRETGQLELDTQEYCDENNVGFSPGQLDGVSWSRDKNVIPLKNYQHSYFEKTKGQEFRLVHTDREKVALNVKPLTMEEKDNNLFYNAV